MASRKHLTGRILSALPEEVLELIAIAQGLEPSGLYLVGGTVRDALLGISSRDVDLLVESDAARLGNALQQRLGGKLNGYRNFGTCTLVLPDGLVVDIARTRAESYPQPGALPQVAPADLPQDLARRDFSVNAMALRLTPAPRRFFDLQGGLEDLRGRELRTLSPRSFANDPTRIIRGARLAGRLGFSFEPATASQTPSGLIRQVLHNVGPERLKAELELTLAEPRVAPALEILDECGALAAMFQMRASLPVLAGLDEQRRESSVPAESYLLALLRSVSEDELDELIRRFHWPKHLIRQLNAVQRIQSGESIDGAKVATRALLGALSPELRQRVERFEAGLARRRLRGQDVLDLGLPAGPQVGWVLAQIAKARADGRTDSFESELTLARTLISKPRTSTPDE